MWKRKKLIRPPATPKHILSDDGASARSKQKEVGVDMKNAFEIRGEITAIFIPYKGEIKETLIDTADLEIASSFKGRWTITKNPNTKKDKFYVFGALYKRDKLALHRLLMNFPKGLDVDHINDDSLNNRRSTNLQAITRSENVKKQVRNRR